MLGVADVKKPMGRSTRVAIVVGLVWTVCPHQSVEYTFSKA